MLHHQEVALSENDYNNLHLFGVCVALLDEVCLFKSPCQALRLSLLLVCVLLYHLCELSLSLQVGM